ncbi:V-type ATP synthase subunit I [Simkania negevensis]|uniref:V-type ATP synthase subunit I n=1 Tax=Simkania negevensis TaxID=83561 RepID=A0ABS3AQA0_9BACT|nr:V-type ATP synthase subunit I [Simkania negevensis]
MRIDCDKHLFIGPASGSEDFFSSVQKLGAVEFITSASTTPPPPDEIQLIEKAIGIVRGQPTVDQEENLVAIDVDRLAQEIVAVRDRLEALYEETRVLHQEIPRVEIFGDFSVEQLREIEGMSGRLFQFFYTKKLDQLDLTEHPELIYVGHMHDLDYLVAISKGKRSYDGLVEVVIDRPIGVLLKEKERVDSEICETEERLKEYARFNHYLHEQLLIKLDTHHLINARGLARSYADDTLFVVEGWVARSSADVVSRFAARRGVYYEEVAVEENDRVPTHLENRGMGRIGEDLVHIYDTPSTTDNDPSKWVLLFFALFFGIIMGDGGYGVSYLVIAVFLYFRFFHIKGGGKRVIKLALILAVSCVVWGILTASFFGLDFSIKSDVKRYSLMMWVVEKKAQYLMEHKDNATYRELVAKHPQLAGAKTSYDFIASVEEVKDGNRLIYPIYNTFSGNILLEFSLFIGVIHMALSFLRNLRRSYAGIGWILFMVGCYLYFPSILKSLSFSHYLFGIDPVAGAEWGLEILCTGVVLAVIVSVVQKKLAGLADIANIIQIFADALSYLRLYALGLAGGIMSATFNEMGSKLGWFFGAIIILLGHIVNISLGIMGGVIHGLRLNFLEWYHWSFEGGGKRFQPLALLHKKEKNEL